MSRGNLGEGRRWIKEQGKPRRGKEVDIQEQGKPRRGKEVDILEQGKPRRAKEVDIQEKRNLGEGRR